MAFGRIPTRKWLPYAVGGLAGLVVLFLAPAVFPAVFFECVQLNVTSSTEKDNLIGHLADRYNEAGRRLASGRCVKVRVDGFTSGLAKNAIADGWHSEESKTHRRPHVWLPSSSIWLTELRDDPGYRDRAALPSAPPSIASSPVVIAMPEAMAKAIGWPGRDLHWKDVLGLDRDTWRKTGHPDWGPFSYVRDNADRSTSGFAATLAAFYAAAGKTQNLTPRDVRSKKVDGFIRQVEANVSFHPLDIMDFLKELDDPGRRHQFSAVVMQEELAFLYNQGNPDGDPPPYDPRVPATQLVAIHPAEGTLMLDHPYITLPGIGEREKEAAESFQKFLMEPAQREDFAALGFRDVRGAAPQKLADSLQFDKAQIPASMAPPTSQVIAEVRAKSRKLSKRADLLIVVDQSGSMALGSATSGENRMEAVKKAIKENSRFLHPEDRVGLWGFASDPENPHSELLARSAFGDGSAFEKAVDRLTVTPPPHNDTALCVTTRNAHEYMLKHSDRSRIRAVVVLTDGKDDYSAPCDMNTLGDELAARDPDHEVRVFSIGIGSAKQKADTAALKKISTATGGLCFDAVKDPRLIDTAFPYIFGTVS